MTRSYNGIVEASEISAKIRNGEDVAYDGFIIKGSLDITPADDPDVEYEYFIANGRLHLTPDDDGVPIISSEISITNSRIDGYVRFFKIVFEKQTNFSDTIFNDHANFGGVQFNGGAIFEGVQFNGNAYFFAAIFNESAYFSEAQINGIADFRFTRFKDSVYFRDSQFRNDAEFTDTKIIGETSFYKATFNSNARFDYAKFYGDTYIRDAKFDGHANFEFAQFNGNNNSFSGSQFNGDELSFKNAIFFSSKSQEETCRKAKNVLERNGNRDEAGYYFYREMEGKRKQKESTYQYFDYEVLLFCNETNVAPRELTDLFNYLRYNILEYFFIQVVFGYGVHPWRLITWWGIMIVTFAGLYWVGSGINGASQLFDYIKFSLATAIAPGYIATIISPGSTGYRLTSEYQAVAILESIFGTFLWAGFIATFAKKYMR